MKVKLEKTYPVAASADAAWKFLQDIKSVASCMPGAEITEQSDETHFKLIGDLTIKDVTREVVLEAEDEGRGKDPWGNQRAGFNLRVTLNRKDFGLAWNQLLEAGGVLVGEAVELTIELQLVQNAKQQVA